MPRSQIDRIADKRRLLIQRTAQVLAVSEVEAEALLCSSRRQSIRLNPLRSDRAAILRELAMHDWVGSPSGWCSDGYYTHQGLTAVSASHLVADGMVFIQNAASWLPIIALDPQPKETILDMCAAPGGKTSHIAAITNNLADITANDNSYSRVQRLRSNMTRLGAQNITYTMYDASQLVRRMPSMEFDRILLDAPCSGEGMIRIDDPKSYATWSVAHIKRLQTLQKRLVTQAWQLLKPGGTLVYSTCTMAPEENEAAIDYLLRKYDDVQVCPMSLDLPNTTPACVQWNGRVFQAAVDNALRLYPSQDIEAFFVCKLQKALG